MRLIVYPFSIPSNETRGDVQAAAAAAMKIALTSPSEFDLDVP